MCSHAWCSWLCCVAARQALLLGRPAPPRLACPTSPAHSQRNCPALPAAPLPRSSGGPHGLRHAGGGGRGPGGARPPPRHVFVLRPRGLRGGEAQVRQLLMHCKRGRRRGLAGGLPKQSDVRQRGLNCCCCLVIVAAASTSPARRHTRLQTCAGGPTRPSCSCPAAACMPTPTRGAPASQVRCARPAPPGWWRCGWAVPGGGER